MKEFYFSGEKASPPLWLAVFLAYSLPICQSAGKPTSNVNLHVGKFYFPCEIDLTSLSSF